MTFSQSKFIYSVCMYVHTYTRCTKILPLIPPSAYDLTIEWVHPFHQGKIYTCAFTKEMLLQNRTPTQTNGVSNLKY